MSVVAIDLGTSNIKALLARWDGTVIENRSVKTPVRTGADGRHGFPADEVSDRAAGLVAGMTMAHPEDTVDSVVFSCLGTAMVPVDRRGRPLGLALSPADERPWSGGGLDSRIDLDPETLRHLTGSDPTVASFLLHWLWWRDAQPEVVERLHRFRSLRGFLVHELCGADAEDQSWASRTMLFDLETNGWSETITDAARLPPEAMPRVLPSTSMWPVRPVVAERFGLSPDARVVLGGMDNCCSFLGATEPTDPRLVNIVGTYEHIAGTGGLDIARAAAAAGDGIVHSYVLPGQYIAMTREPVGLLLSLIAESGPESLHRLLDSVSEEPTGLRTPLDPDAVTATLQRGTPASDVLQGLLESAVEIIGRFADAWATSGSSTEHLSAVGGGSTRTNLLQLKANLLGRSISTLSSDEGAGLGALRLAAMAIGDASPTEASELFPNPIVRTLAPRVRSHPSAPAP